MWRTETYSVSKEHHTLEASLQQLIREVEAQQAALQRELAELYRQAGVQTRPPLAGVRILDLSWVVFGPLSTQMLSDMGAEVIKVERVDGGDMGRQTYSAYFTNRNKQSLAVDLRRPEGREIVLKLAQTAHVFFTTAHIFLLNGEIELNRYRKSFIQKML